MPRFIVFLLGVLACSPVNCTSPLLPQGFSYTRFSGPVSGPEKEIVVYDPNDFGHPHVDYIAKPDYQFSYGVDDPLSNVLQNRKESRYGDVVQGEYSFIEPDGSLRVVKYVADDAHGFQAEVITEKLSNAGATYPAVAAEIPVYEESAMHDDTHAPVTSSALYSTNKQSSFRESALPDNEGEPNEATYSTEHSFENKSFSYNVHQKSEDSENSADNESADVSY